VSELMRVRNLVKHFPVEEGVLLSRLGGHVSAVEDVSFDVREGQTLGLVGESGCGKSTTGRCIMRLYRPTAGAIEYRGLDVHRVRGRELKAYRREVQIIFQDPYASLNPRMTVGEIVSEPLKVHKEGTRRAQTDRVRDLLDRVGLNPEHINRYSHEFSGGQRQRIGIARALALQPKLIICDEPVSALDVSIQAQVLNLLEDLQKEFGLAYLFIAHDLSVVRHISEDVAVMYLGKIVETANWKDLYDSPHHPYTQSLLSAVPVPDPEKQKARERIILEGDVPSPIDPPTGCRFHTRCPIARFPRCSEEIPELREVGSGHHAACHFAKEFPIPVEGGHLHATAGSATSSGEGAQPG
jgi:oligopeptide transport system ATP-binding protein